MAIRDRIRNYRRTGGIPETTEDSPDFGTVEAACASIMVLIVGAVVSSIVILPLAIAVYVLLDSLLYTVLLLAVPDYLLARYLTLYVGGAVVDEIVGVERVAAE
jgi:hypothetical protein